MIEVYALLMRMLCSCACSARAHALLVRTVVAGREVLLAAQPREDGEDARRDAVRGQPGHERCRPGVDRLGVVGRACERAVVLREFVFGRNSGPFPPAVAHRLLF